jgi:hypothetical protein
MLTGDEGTVRTSAFAAFVRDWTRQAGIDDALPAGRHDG